MLAVSILAEDNSDEDEPTCFTAKDALQILQLGNGSSRECSICKTSNCKECWQVKELLWGLNCLGQDLDEEEHEADCNHSLYFRTLEKYITNLTYRKKTKEKTPSAVLSQDDEGMLSEFFKILIENKEKKEGCPKCKEEKEAIVEEVEFTQHLAQIEQIASKSDGSRQQQKKKGRKAKMKLTEDIPKGKLLSKSEALRLDSKRKNEMEDIRKELMKKAKLADEPKHQPTHIAVRKEIIDEESRQEIERQRHEKENRRLDLQKKMKQQAVQERHKYKKLRRNQKKQSFNSSSSSAYPSSISDISLNTSSDCSSMDSSINDAKDEKQKTAHCKLEAVSENPLFEDRKRGVTNPQEMQVEEPKKMKLSEEGEPSSIDSGFDKDKEKLKNEQGGGERKKNQRKNQLSKQRKKKKKNSRSQNVPGSGQLEESSSGSFLQSVETKMETDLSTDHSAKSSSQYLSLSSSSNESPSNPLLPDPGHVPASNCPSHLSYADIAAASVSPVKAQPVGRSHANEVSILSGNNTSHQPRFSPIMQPLFTPHPVLKIAPPPGFNRQQPLNQKTPFLPSLRPFTTSYHSSHNFSPKVSQGFTVRDTLSLQVVRNQISHPRTQPTVEVRDIGTHNFAKGIRIPKLSDVNAGMQISAEPMESTIQYAEKSSLDVRVNERIEMPCIFENVTNNLSSTHQTISDFQNFTTMKCNSQKTTSRNGLVHEKSLSKASLTTSKDNLEQSIVEELGKKLSENLTLANSKDTSCPNVDLELAQENISCVLNQRHIPDHWDDNLFDEDEKETIKRPIEESCREAVPDTVKDIKSKHPQRSNDFSNIKRNLKSKRHIVNENISLSQKEKSENPKFKDEGSSLAKIQNSVLASFEHLAIKDDARGVGVGTKVIAKAEVENEAQSVLSEKSKKWTLLAPHNARESGRIQTKKENERKNETVMMKSQPISMKNDNTLSTSRAGFNIKNFHTTKSSDSAFSGSIVSSCQPNSPTKSRSSNESLLKKAIRTGKPREIHENTFVFSSEGISPQKSHEILVSEGISIADVKTNLETKGGKENWSLGIIDNSHKNFLLATQNCQNSLRFDEQLSSPSSSPRLLQNSEVRTSSTPLKDKHFLQSLMAESKQTDSYKFMDRKILHPIRRPKTTTQCMQASQVGGMRSKTTKTDSWLELFSFDKSQSSNVPSNGKEKPLDKRNIIVKDDDKNTTRTRTNLMKRSANPSALLQHALGQIKEERGLSPNSRIVAARQSRKDNSDCPTSGSIHFPSKPSMKTVDKLPKLNIAGLSSFYE